MINGEDAMIAMLGWTRVGQARIFQDARNHANEMNSQGVDTVRALWNGSEWMLWHQSFYNGIPYEKPVGSFVLSTADDCLLLFSLCTKVSIYAPSISSTSIRVRP